MCDATVIICILSGVIHENQMGWGMMVMWKLSATLPQLSPSLTDRMHVWTSTALGSNNCILDVSKHGIPAALCRGEPSRSPVKGRLSDVPRLVKAPGLFAPWANCVYYHTFLVSVQSTAAKQAGRPSKPLFPGVKSCHLRMCHFCLPALSHLLAHFAWAGEICATCHCLPVWPWDWWNTFSEKVMVTDRVFTSFCEDGKEKKRGGKKKEEQCPLINTIFTHWAEKDRADSIFRNLDFYLSHATVNKQKTEKNQFRFFF